jgi:hypothetical protein
MTDHFGNRGGYNSQAKRVQVSNKQPGNHVLVSFFFGYHRQRVKRIIEAGQSENGQTVCFILTRLERRRLHGLVKGRLKEVAPNQRKTDSSGVTGSFSSFIAGADQTGSVIDQCKVCSPGTTEYPSA